MATTTSHSIGVDWAGEDWLCLSVDEANGLPDVTHGDTLEELWEDHGGAANIGRFCVDVPIGIPEGPDERPVDKRCRAELKRKSTVFRVPVREALEQETQTAASRESRRITGQDGSKGVGVQPPAFSIRAQILEANSFAQSLSRDERSETLFEVHPELCYRAFAGQPPQFSKKSAQGVAERLAALDTVSGSHDAATVFGETVRSLKRESDSARNDAVDDVLDALAALYTASAPDTEFQTLHIETAMTDIQARMAYRSETEFGIWESS